RAAKRAARQREQEAAQAAEASALADTTVAEAATWWAREAELERLAPSTVELRRRLVRDHVGVVMGDRRVRDLADEDMTRLAQRLAPLSAGFARLIMRALKGLLATAR